MILKICIFSCGKISLKMQLIKTHFKGVRLHAPITRNTFLFRQKVLTSVACYHGRSFSWLEIDYTSFQNFPRSALSSIQPKAETSTTHFREIFGKSFHNVNRNRGSVVKQSAGTDVVFSILLLIFFFMCASYYENECKFYLFCLLSWLLKSRQDFLFEKGTHIYLPMYKQEAVKASNSPRDRKDGIRMAKKIFEGRQLFSSNDIFLERCAFNRSDVGRRSVLIPLNASIRLRQNSQ